MKFVMNKGPFLRNKRSTTGIMLELFVALCVVWVASIVFYSINFGALGGLRVFGVGGVSILTTLLIDVVMSLIKKKRTFKEIGSYVLKSYSYVTALIFALCLPAGTSFYVVVLGALFATIIGKYVFGGFGNNIFNPAILGRIFVGLAFSDKLQILEKTSNGIDVVSGATLTGSFNWTTGLSSFTGDNKITLLNTFLGNYQGAIGETFTALLIVLGIYLIVRGIINYRLALSYLLTATLCALGVGLVYKVDNIGVYLANMLCTGGLMFATVFMITDPVTSPKSQDGKIIYGSVAGFLAMFIRVFSSYPEGVMFSIALGNMITPLIDGWIKGNTFDRLPSRITKLVAVPVVATLLASSYALIPTGGSEEGKAGGLPQTSSRNGAAPVIVDTGVTRISDSLYEVKKAGFMGDIVLTVRVDVFNNKFTSVQIKSMETEERASDWTDSYIGDDLEIAFSELDAFTCEGLLCTKTGTSSYDITTDATYTSSAVINALKSVASEVTSKALSITKVSTNVYRVTKEAFDGPMTIEFTVDDTKVINANILTVDPGEYYHAGIEQIKSDGPSGTNNIYDVWFGDNVDILFTDIDAFVKNKNKYTKSATVSDIDVLSEATYTTNAIVDAFKEVVDAKRGEVK